MRVPMLDLKPQLEQLGSELKRRSVRSSTRPSTSWDPKSSDSKRRLPNMSA